MDIPSPGYFFTGSSLAPVITTGDTKMTTAKTRLTADSAGGHTLSLDDQKLPATNLPLHNDGHEHLAELKVPCAASSEKGELPHSRSSGTKAVNPGALERWESEGGEIE
jgi:hypothetical protein